MTSNVESELVSEKKLIYSLSNCRSSEKTFETLIKIRTKLIKQANGVKTFRDLGGIKLLLPLIQQTNSEIINIGLSILGNCCLESETRREVKRLNGIEALVTILKALDSESILNRACRTLANLALDDDIAEIILKHDILPFIVKFLQSTQNSDNQQTAIRTLRILACTSKHRDDIVKCGGIRFTAELLSSTNDKVRLCSVRALAHFTQQCSEQCAQQVNESQLIQELVSLATHGTDCIQEYAIIALVNLAHQSCIRPIIGSTGAVQVFIDQSEILMKMDPLTMACEKVPLMAAGALCLCCRESVNRVKIREGGGLKILLYLLTTEVNRTIHEQAVINLLNFLYDDQSLDILLELGLIPILIEKLAKYIRENPQEHERNYNMQQMKKQISFDKVHYPSAIVNKSNAINNIRRASSETIPETHIVGIGNNKSQEHGSHEQFQNVKNSITSSKDNHCTHSIQAPKNQVYDINSPSYQEIQNELKELVKVENELQPARNTWNPWSPGNECCSPENFSLRTYSPKTFSSLYTTNLINTGNSEASPGSSSPDWIPQTNNDFLIHGHCSTLNSNTKYSFSCGSSMCISPDTSSPPAMCYSPVCEEFSEEEEEEKNGCSAETSTSDNGNGSSSSPLLLEKEITDTVVESSECNISNQGEDNLISFFESTNEKEMKSQYKKENLNEFELGCNSAPSKSQCKLRCRASSATFDSIDEMGNPWWQEDEVESPYISHLMMLLSRFSQMEKPNLSILTVSCIETLLDALVLTPRPISRAGRILKRLARNPLCLKPLIIIRFPLLISSYLQSHKHESCSICKILEDLAESLHSTLSMQAEAPFGIGVLANMLSSGTESEKIAASLMTPYLLRNNVKYLRHKIMIDYGGLEIISNLLEKPEEQEYPTAVQSLVKISDYLKKAPVIEAAYFKKTHPKVTECCYKRYENIADFIFVLDNETKMYANRSILSNRSAVFNAMLTGCFKESNQKEIRIQDASADGLSYILHYLYGCRYDGANVSSVHSTHIECHVMKFCDIDLLLEVFCLSDRLLLEDLKKWIETFIRSSFLNTSNAIKIYSFARSRNFEDLAVLVIEYLLGNSVSSAEKTVQLTELLKSELKAVALSDIMHFIQQYL